MEEFQGMGVVEGTVSETTATIFAGKALFCNTVNSLPTGHFIPKAGEIHRASTGDPAEVSLRP